jgi:chromosome partitioning protein
MFDERVNLAKQVVEEVRDVFGDQVYQTVIPRNVRLSEAPSHGKAIFKYDIRSRGSEAYFYLSKEFMEHEAKSTRARAEESDSQRTGGEARPAGGPDSPVGDAGRPE